MNEQIIIGIFTLGGAIIGGVIGGVFSLMSARVGYKKDTMEKDIRLLANQVKSYWHLEKEYIAQIEKLGTKPKETIMRDTRKIIENNGYGYPNMTANGADSILRKYN